LRLRRGTGHSIFPDISILIDRHFTGSGSQRKPAASTGRMDVMDTRRNRFSRNTDAKQFFGLDNDVYSSPRNSYRGKRKMAKNDRSLRRASFQDHQSSSQVPKEAASPPEEKKRESVSVSRGLQVLKNCLENSEIPQREESTESRWIKVPPARITPEMLARIDEICREPPDLRE